MVKPGPKSSKQIRIVKKHASLGDTSSNDSNSDDDSAENTVNDGFQRQKTARTPQNRANAEASNFCTPEAENDATDYGLEFTTSRIMQPSPRRCSTIRMAGSSQEDQEIAENGASTSNRTTKLPAGSKPVKKATQQKSTKSKTVTAKTRNNPSAAEQVSAVTTQPIKKPRKQANPIQLEKRFWKDVRVLQNCTDNLIPMLPFSRLVRDIIHEASIHVTKITPTALQAIQCSAELYLTQRLQDAYMLTLHRGRITLDVRDMQLLNHLKINL